MFFHINRTNRKKTIASPSTNVVQEQFLGFSFAKFGILHAHTDNRTNFTVEPLRTAGTLTTLLILSILPRISVKAPVIREKLRYF